MKQIFSIVLAVIFLISSTGFTISKHHCGGRVHDQSIGFTSENLSCRMETGEEASCEKIAFEDDFLLTLRQVD